MEEATDHAKDHQGHLKINSQPQTKREIDSYAPKTRRWGEQRK